MTTTTTTTTTTFLAPVVVVVVTMASLPLGGSQLVDGTKPPVQVGVSGFFFLVVVDLHLFVCLCCPVRFERRYHILRQCGV